MKKPVSPSLLHVALVAGISYLLVVLVLKNGVIAALVAAVVTVIFWHAQNAYTRTVILPETGQPVARRALEKALRQTLPQKDVLMHVSQHLIVVYMLPLYGPAEDGCLEQQDLCGVEITVLGPSEKGVLETYGLQAVSPHATAADPYREAYMLFDRLKALADGDERQLIKMLLAQTADA